MAGGEVGHNLTRAGHEGPLLEDDIGAMNDLCRRMGKNVPAQGTATAKALRQKQV